MPLIDEAIINKLRRIVDELDVVADYTEEIRAVRLHSEARVLLYAYLQEQERKKAEQAQMVSLGHGIKTGG